MRADVVVVGAGVSGLSCAKALAEAGLAVVILESRNRLGGRIHSLHPADEGPAVELGAQVVHGSHNPIGELVGPPNLVAVPRDVAARVLIDGVNHGMGVLARGRRAPWTVQAMLNAAPGADDRSVDEWLRSVPLRDEEGVAAREWLRQHWAADPADLSTLGVAAAHRGDEVGDGEYAIQGGFDHLPQLLGLGLDVRCENPVRSLDWSPGGVIARTDAGPTESAVAVVTVPPAVISAGGLRIDLPPRKQAALDQLRAGDGYCAALTLSRPAPESAIVLDLDGAGGFIRCTVGRPEVLIVAKAAAAAAMRSAPTPRELLARALPWTAEAHVVGVIAADWGRAPSSLGAFTHPRPGAGWAADAWAEPIAGTLFFAGEATVSGRMLPWVHGAAWSGRRAAEQILEVVA